MIIRIAFILLTFSSLYISCKGDGNHTNRATNSLRDTVLKSKFQLLDFMADNKPSIALIDTSYKNFNRKKDFSISLFVTVATIDTIANGYPTPNEEMAFRGVEESILANLHSLDTRYIGKTTMSGYRDIIFYIAEKDQKRVSQSLAITQKKFPRIKSYVFEKDPDWEAVSEFYLALGKAK